ncbi:MAG: hypothetical protein GXY55_01295 [Phycisphaerae bacterium]|nr:hypothetical protein [Phycisphaerae bacterium]
MPTAIEETLNRLHQNLHAGRLPREGIDPQAWQTLLNRYARFEDTRDAAGFLTDSEVVITSLRTPRPCLHLMASGLPREVGTWGSFWDQLGGGFSCLTSVLAGRMTSHLDTNYVPTAPEPQDVRRFFIHEQGRAWPMFPVPGVEEDAYSGWRCLQGLDRMALHAERGGLTCSLEVSVHPGLPLESWQVSVSNTGDTPRRFSWFADVRVNVDSFPSYYFVPRIVCEGLLEEDALVFLNHDQNNRHRRQAFFLARPRFAGFDMMGEIYNGVGGRSVPPAAVREGRCRNSLGLQPYAGLVAAAQFNADLAPGESARWVCAYGWCPYETDQRREYLARVRSDVLADPDHCTSAVRRGWMERIQSSMIRTPSADLDRYFNIWSRYQARNQSRFCRALDKIGYRDVLQDLLGVCDCEPSFVRRQLLHTLRYQAADGRAVRQYEACPGAGQDMRMYMDSSSWIPDTLVQYLKESGDFGVLDEPVAYFDMQTQQPDDTHTGTVYEHALAAVRSLAANTGYHGLCRIGYGDWNDALSGIGGEKGVSVWLSCACIHAAQRMEELASHLGREDHAREMHGLIDTLTRRINEHAWDGKWYIYAINGRGLPIGSKDNPEGRIHLNVNTWALFTGVAAAAGREEAVHAAIERLATPLGHRLLAPPYSQRSRADVGRIADQKPGLFENGSLYLHGEAFYLYALVHAGRGDECYDWLVRTLPSSLVQDLATGPRQQQSNFTVGPDHPAYGKQLFSNFTGSVSWYRRVIERLVGVWADFDALVIQPCPPKTWTNYEVRRQWRGRAVHVAFKRTGPPGARIRLNGQACGQRVPLASLSTSKVNRIEVEFG